MATELEHLLELLKGHKVSSVDNRVPLDDDEEICVIGADECHTDDSICAPCQGCGRRIWLAPDTQRMMIERGNRVAMVVCIHCAMNQLEEEK
jgi:hypothetical protein